jgi:serine/threonine-protein kinase
MPACQRCGVQAIPAASFCAACGARLAAAPAPPAEDPLLGRVIRGVYRVDEKIGTGGMGEVYRAVHRGLDAPVAVKIIKPSLLEDAAMVHRFEREARAASRLRHPNVVSVTDFGQDDDGTLYMVMECLTGKSLARVIAEDAPLPDRRAVDIGAQILAALAEAHAHGILHRDLKPENVMIESRRDAPDAVKVLDFGIAKTLAAGAPSSTLTQAGLVCGTPGYMSPEQLRNEELDPRSDLFAAGMVLYEMLTQKLPFDAKTPWELLHRHLTEPVPPPSERLGRPVTPALERLVLSAVSARRDERPASAEAMREALLAVPLPGGRRASGPLATAVLAPDAPAPGQSGVDPAILVRIEARLAATLGPLAGQVVRAHAREVPDLAGLCARLAASVPTGDRDAFVAWCRESLGMRPPRPSPPATPGATLDPALLDRAARELAEYLGPLARVVVRRVSVRATDAASLCDLLAAEIPSESDRAAFRRRLAGHGG